MNDINRHPQQVIQDWIQLRRTAPLPESFVEQVMDRIVEVTVPGPRFQSNWLCVGLRATATAAAIGFCLVRLLELFVPFATAS